MFDIIDGYEEEDVEEGQAPLNVSASPDGKTLTVVLKSNYSYFFELFEAPIYMPVKWSIVEPDQFGWANSASTYIGNGPFKMASWIPGNLIVFEKNEYYHNGEAILLDQIRFVLSDNPETILPISKADCMT